MFFKNLKFILRPELCKLSGERIAVDQEYIVHKKMA